MKACALFIIKKGGKPFTEALCKYISFLRLAAMLSRISSASDAVA